jgi:mannose-1-phosphate guanylyltransferase/mannose-6-phosphate isomerase
VLVLAADHFIPNTEAFVTAVAAGTWDAELGFPVTFGVKHDLAAMGYGCIAPSANQYGHSLEVASFIEKPDQETAARYVAEVYLGNSGNFLFQAKTYLPL